MSRIRVQRRPYGEILHSSMEGATVSYHTKAWRSICFLRVRLDRWFQQLQQVILKLAHRLPER